MSVLNVHFTTGNDEWATPHSLFAELAREFPFTLDVCATAENAKCRRYFTRKDDGLRQDWKGICWMNPPYGRHIDKWIRKAYESSVTGATVICLIPARTDTAWWHNYVMKGEIRFLRGRVHFNRSKVPAPFPSAVVIFRPPTEAHPVLIQPALLEAEG